MAYLYYSIFDNNNKKVMTCPYYFESTQEKKKGLGEEKNKIFGEGNGD